MKFEDFLQKLKNKTVEQIVSTISECTIECFDNSVYEDGDLHDFLRMMGAEITYMREDGHTVIRTEEGIYEVPYKYKPNRFGEDLPGETILFFEPNKISQIK